MNRVIGLLLLMLVSAGVIAQNDTWYVINNVTSDDGKVGWNNYENWTLDPSASVFYNPDGEIPDVDDYIVVKAGKDITIPAGTIVSAERVILDGNLYINEINNNSSFSSLEGSGRLHLKGDNFPATTEQAADFISERGGTVVFQNSQDIILNSEYNFNNLSIETSADAAVKLNQNLSLNGGLTIRSGDFIIAGSTNLNVDIQEDILVQEDGLFGVSNVHPNVYHNLIVWGNFKNYGTLTFSNTPQYAAATHGAVKLTFKGASDNDFIANGSTNLYRLLVDKGDDDFYTLSVTSNDENNLKFFGPFEKNMGIEPSESGLEGWKTLPLVLMHGTLKLGANIHIEKLGYLRSGSEPKEFFVPEGSGLWINGATINTGQGSTVENWQANGTGLSVAGTLKITDGSFTIPEFSSGLTYRGTETKPAELIVDGGELKLTQLRSNNNSGYLDYKQSAGKVEFYTSAGAPYTSPVFSLPNESQVFEMSGGDLTFKVSNDRGAESNGLYITSAQGNHNVTGGTIRVETTGNRKFEILSTAPFYNLEIATGQGSQPVEFREHQNFPKQLNILNDFSIGNGTTVNSGNYELLLGGDFVLNGTFNNTNGNLTLNRTGNVSLINNSGNILSLNNFYVEKTSAENTVELTGSNGFSMGSITLTRGNLDFVDKEVPVSGNVNLRNGSLLTSNGGEIQLTGTSTLNSEKGKELAFGKVKVQNSITLTSDALVETLIFDGDHVVDINSFNLELENANFSENGGWNSNKMFRTNGLASDGGLTLPVILNANYGTNTLVQTFPVGTSAGYTPAEVYARNNLNNIGNITVIPVNGHHSTVADETYALDYYWRVLNDGLNGVANNLRYRFKNYVNVNVPTYVHDWGTRYYPTGLVFFNNEWTELNANVNGTFLTFPFSANLSKDFSYGVLQGGSLIVEMPAPRTYYSLGNGDWDDRDNWSIESHYGDELPDGGWFSERIPLPSHTDYCIISPQHTITIDANNADASQVEINGRLVVEDGTNDHDIDVIKGAGHLVFEHNGGGSNGPGNLINGDYSEFCNSESAIIEFSGSGDYNVPPKSKIAYYPNLTISGGGTKGTVYESLSVRGDLFIDDANLNITGVNNGELNIGGLLKINTGEMTLPGESTHDVNIETDIVFEGNGKLTSADNYGNGNNVYLKGNISLGNGTIDFNSGNKKVNLYFAGDESATFTGNNTDVDKARFYKVIIDKPEAEKVEFTAPFSVSSDLADDEEKGLHFISGTAHLNHSKIDLTLNSSNAYDFRLPASAQLIIDNSAKVRASGNGSGFFLDGSLKVINGGNFLWEGTGSNHVRYSASGNASVTVGDNATFKVGSQFYRNSDGGVLKFHQTHAISTVEIGTVDATAKNYPVFEVINGGSEFVQSQEGSVISILRGQTDANEPAFVFDPATVIIAEKSKFVLGNAGGQAMELLVKKPLENVEVAEGGNAITLKTTELFLNGGLSVGDNSEFDANGLNVTLLGDLELKGSNVQGGYNANSNTTYFESNGSQSITGNVEFYNLASKSGKGTLVIGSGANVKVGNNLEWLSGSIDSENVNIEVNGNVTTALDASVAGILMANDTEMQLLAGGGNIGRLEIDNSNGVMVPSQPDPIFVSEQLKLTLGILNIGGNLLELSESAVIEDGSGSGFSEDNMVQTFLSFTDAGLKKNYSNISTLESFVYPIGSQKKYTPVTLNIRQLSSANGYIRVKAANEPHITIPVDDKNSVLQYNWTLDAHGISDFKANVEMQAYPGDVLPLGHGANYIVARIKASSSKWNREDVSGGGNIDEQIYFDNDNSNLIFNGYFASENGTDDVGISGDYTAGLPDALPVDVPTYISVVEDGHWNDKNTWAVFNPSNGQTGIAGDNVQQGGPFGAIVYIDKDVNLESNGKTAYRTYINSGATLNAKSTINHRLGNVYGRGRLRVESGSLPGGFYEDFFCSDGGTVEYAGIDDYSVLSETQTLNNVEFTGSGDRNLPSGNIRVYGDVWINGAELNIGGSTELEIGQTFTFDSGLINASAGSKVLFKGHGGQSISGNEDISGINALADVVFDNANGIAVSTNLEAYGTVSLLNGVVNTAEGGKLIVSNSAINALSGQNNKRYVDGPLVKFVNGSETYNFPVGSKGRYGELIVETDNSSGGLWEVEYYNANPANANPAMDPTLFEAGDLKFVSHNEYWRVKAPATANAGVTVRWDEHSGFSTESAETQKLRMTQWNSANEWSIVDGSVYHNEGDAFGTVESASSVGFNHFNDKGNFFTIGSIEKYLYDWTGDQDSDWFNPGNWDDGKVPTANTDITIGSASRYPEIGLNSEKDAYALDLTINSGADVTLHAGASLNVTGLFENNGDVILKSNPNAVAALNVPVDNADSGHGIIELSGVKANQWYRFGQPIESSTGEIYKAGDAKSWVYRSTTNWQRIQSNSDIINPMEGIMVLYEQDQTLSYEGQLNTGQKTWTIPYGRGYYLFSNPYPGSMRWDISNPNTGVSVSDNVASTIYYRVYAGAVEDDYMITYNGFSGFSTLVDGETMPGGYTTSNIGNISPMQSVWVRVNDSEEATITVDNRARVADNSLPLKSASSSSDRDVIRIIQSNAFISDVAVVYFDDYFQEGIDRSDSEKMMNGSKYIPEIFTRVDNKNLAINGLPAIVVDQLSIPLSVRIREKGEVSISMALDDFTDNYEVWLEDLELEIHTNMREVEQYTFEWSNSGYDHNRFVMHLIKKVEIPTGIAESNITEAGQIMISGFDNYALVKISPDLLTGGSAEISLMDLNGRRIRNKETVSSETQIQLPDATGVYLIKVTVGDQQKTAKVMRN